MISAAGSSSPSASRRPATTPCGTTAGIPIRCRSRSSRYSRNAIGSTVSFTAYTRSRSRTMRTTWRESPRGSGTTCSSPHSSSGVAQGRVMIAGSGRLATMRRAIR